MHGLVHIVSVRYQSSGVVCKSQIVSEKDHGRPARPAHGCSLSASMVDRRFSQKNDADWMEIE